MLYSDLQEVKALLEIPVGDTSENTKLLFFIEYASGIIEEILNRPGMSYKQRTEIYSGTGTKKLLLRSRPVRVTPAIRVWFDSSAYYGSTEDPFPDESELTYGRDFCLQLDGEDLTKSRSGILFRIGTYWPQPGYRDRGLISSYIGDDLGSIKVSYYGGYTVDDLPSNFRLAANLIISRLRYIFPLGVELTSESYEDRHIAVATSVREGLVALAKPLLISYRNWRF